MNNPLMRKINHTEYKPTDTFEDRRKMHDQIVQERQANNKLIEFPKQNSNKSFNQ
jgi:hypothetical protein